MKIIIKGGTLVYSSGIKQEDMLINEGKIEAIKSTIHPTGEEQIIDGSTSFILPGFVASRDQSSEPLYKHGITTYIESLEGGMKEDAIQANSSIYDFVYQVSLSELNKELFKNLRLKHVKVLKLNPALSRVLDWELWQPRMKRQGIVLEVDEEDYPFLKDYGLPMIVPFGKKKKITRVRTILKVDGEQIPTWEKGISKQDPFILGGYWVDTLEYPLPKLTSDQEVVSFLMRLVKSRASIPAKVFGVYPRKGSLRIGADADFLLVSKESVCVPSGTIFKPSGTWMKGIPCVEGETFKSNGHLLSSHQTYAFTY